MKIMDEKGRLFGKINIVDLIVVVFMLSFMSMAYYGYRIMTSEKIIPDKEHSIVEVSFQAIISEVAQAMKEGDIGGNKALGERGVLEKIVSIKPASFLILPYLEGESGNAKMTSHPFMKDVTVKLNLLCTKKDELLYYSDEPVKIGSPVIFSTNLYDATGVIMSIEKE